MVRNRVPHIAAAFVIATSAVATAGLGIAVPTPAYADETSADLQAKLDEANARLSDLQSQATQINEQVNDAQYQLDQTNAQIEQTKADIAQKQEELAAAQETLSKRVSSDYKSGGVSLASIILDSSSFDDLATRVAYASKVSDSDSKAIAEVKSLEADLKQKQSDLEQQQAEQQQAANELASQQEALNAQVAELNNYTASLDQQVKDKLAEEQAAREAEARAQAEAAQAAANANNGNYVEENTTTNNGGEANNGGGTSAGNNGGSSNGGSVSSGGSSSGGSYDSGSVNTIIAAATSKIGSPYVFAAGGPNSFDCSGLVAWCYAPAGYSLPHSSGALASYCNKPASEAVPGDILWRPGHVAIYIGGGMTIEAFNPSMGVTYGTNSGFQRAGSPLG